jgi:hypothetical protein
MKRQEFLLNLTLATIIGALGFSIYDSHKNPPEMPVRTKVEPTEEEDPTGTTAPKTETPFDGKEAGRKYPNLGKKDVYVALITPTPSPTPPPPKPTETPNINASTAPWVVQGILNGLVTIEDSEMTKKGVDGNVWEMKVGDTKDADIGKGQIKAIALQKVDEVTNPDEPTATFIVKDFPEAIRVIRMGNEPGMPAAAAPAPAPGAQLPPGVVIPR